MLPAVIPTTLYSAADLVRVDDPHHADAITRSETGAVLAGPPAGGWWRRESVPEHDALASEEAWGQLESVTVTNADLWHREGITGRGVKVAVFDLAWFAGETDPAVAGDVTTHDCFASPSCEVPFDPLRPHLDVEGGLHGWACAEAIRDVAPGVELHLVRVPSFTVMENAVAWAVREGIDVVSMSMSYYNDSFYDGKGPHEALARDLEAAGVLWVGSAGNDALGHWRGPWADADGDDRLDGDGDDGLWAYFEGDVSVYLNWNQHGRCGFTDLSLSLTDDDGTLFGIADADQVLLDQREEGEDCEPVERLSTSVPYADYYRLVVGRNEGSVVGLDLDLIARTGTFLSPVRNGSLTDPKSHPWVVAVGAVRAARYFDGPIESYSAWGPTATGVPKPEIAGPDGLTSVAYGPVGFFGTSASAPVVAGLVALVMEDDPSLTSRAAFERLAAWAIPTDAPGFAPDDRFGAGRARLPVPDPGPAGCGRRPLLLLFLPLPWWSRLRRRGERP